MQVFFRLINVTYVYAKLLVIVQLKSSFIGGRIKQDCVDTTINGLAQLGTVFILQLNLQWGG